MEIKDLIGMAAGLVAARNSRDAGNPAARLVTGTVVALLATATSEVTGKAVSRIFDGKALVQKAVDFEKQRSLSGHSHQRRPKPLPVIVSSGDTRIKSDNPHLGQIGKFFAAGLAAQTIATVITYKLARPFVARQAATISEKLARH